MGFRDMLQKELDDEALLKEVEDKREKDEETEKTRSIFVERFGLEPDIAHDVCVTVDGVSLVRRKNNYLAPFAVFDVCPTCGEVVESGDCLGVRSIARAWKNLFKYHYCPKPPAEPDTTAEGRLLAALRDLIAEAVENN